MHITVLEKWKKSHFSLFNQVTSSYIGRREEMQYSPLCLRLKNAKSPGRKDGTEDCFPKAGDWFIWSLGFPTTQPALCTHHPYASMTLFIFCISIQPIVALLRSVHKDSCNLSAVITSDSWTPAVKRLLGRLQPYVTVNFAFYASRECSLHGLNTDNPHWNIYRCLTDFLAHYSNSLKSSSEGATACSWSNKVFQAIYQNLHKAHASKEAFINLFRIIW